MLFLLLCRRITMLIIGTQGFAPDQSFIYKKGIARTT